MENCCQNVPGFIDVVGDANAVASKMANFLANPQEESLDIKVGGQSMMDCLGMPDFDELAQETDLGFDLDSIDLGGDDIDLGL